MLHSRLRSRSLVLALALVLLVSARSETALGLTIFGGAARPEAADVPVFDPTDYELGTAFSSSIAGRVTAPRVYVGPVEGANPGSIVGTLWDAYGSVLGSAAFGPIVVGWNEVTLTSPIAIAAGTTYVVSANTNAGTTGTGSYAFDSAGGAGFFGGGYVNGPLTATSGLFNTTPGAFPASTFPPSNGGSSYFRDVQFTPIPEPSMAMLLGLGLCAMGLGRRRRQGA
ncbi:MAG: DUF4082 domain-containing protein [Myxococcota bacterium]